MYQRFKCLIDYSKQTVLAVAFCSHKSFVARAHTRVHAHALTRIARLKQRSTTSLTFS